MEAISARTLAQRYLAGWDARRWRHVEGVAERAAQVVAPLALDGSVLVSAAWLHDVGYAPALVAEGLHSLDGARFLRREGVDPRVVNLVAHHSCAYMEAEERGLAEVLRAEFPIDESLPHEVLCFCDMTTGPSGQSMDVEERIAEIKSRYGPEDVVTRFITEAESEIVATVRRVESQLVSQSR